MVEEGAPAVVEEGAPAVVEEGAPAVVEEGAPAVVEEGALAPVSKPPVPGWGSVGVLPGAPGWVRVLRRQGSASPLRARDGSSRAPVRRLSGGRRPVVGTGDAFVVVSRRLLAQPPQPPSPSLPPSPVVEEGALAPVSKPPVPGWGSVGVLPGAPVWVRVLRRPGFASPLRALDGSSRAPVRRLSGGRRPVVGPAVGAWVSRRLLAQPPQPPSSGPRWLRKAPTVVEEGALAPVSKPPRTWAEFAAQPLV
ncbi:hypothetical protein FHU40_002777 [Nocardioides soli]|uniref:Uncharacterized protein n=1 Tax=Nocardioides soli TaxID=1036020 RepID=A0A7W4VX39_9ACTN|nr:hypothetical protein [Nocardioides soli]